MLTETAPPILSLIQVIRGAEAPVKHVLMILINRIREDAAAA
jgi:hypothetical protein